MASMTGDGLAGLFSGRPVLCDGAMGTMLYSCGVFINRSYDELNVTQPDTVRQVHEEYLQAGAEVVETNTFGANALRLEHFGLRERVRELNLAGAQIARRSVDAHKEKHAARAFVAGAVGSLGPVGEMGPEGIRTIYREQIAALAEGGVDLLIAETMMSVVEAEQAVAAAREAAPGMPIAVLATIREDGLCLDGTTAEEFARRLTAAGADAVGCNCSSGPEAVLAAVERMREATELPLVAMPNAGLPRNVEGRHIYMGSPEYMGSFAQKFVRAGVSWVGGCCGTTPAHIRAMRGRLRAVGAQTVAEEAMERRHAGPAVSVGSARAEEDEARGVEPPALEERSGVGKKIARGEWVTLVEI